uniref:Uncharacterized protein n=1 Tax=viral metagenome TaxID=1070528 RepID=A0A6C0BEF7_9ZZZZ
MMDYIIVGLIIVVFIFEIIIVWYMWWTYTQMNNDVIDCQDMVIDIYSLQIAELKKEGLETVVKIPKRIQDRMDKKTKK